MQITPKDKVGYIRKYKDKDGKEQFRFIETKIKKIVVGKKKVSVYTEYLRALDADDLATNTEFLQDKDVMLVSEPFITTDEYSEHCRKTVDYWNEHGAKKVFD